MNKLNAVQINSIDKMIMEIEKQYNVRVIHAVLAGVHGMDIHSKKSNIVVNCIYTWKNSRDHFRLSNPNPSISVGRKNIRIYGLSMHKALVALRDSHPMMLDMLQSEDIIKSHVAIKKHLTGMTNQFNARRLASYLYTMGNNSYVVWFNPENGKLKRAIPVFYYIDIIYNFLGVECLHHRPGALPPLSFIDRVEKARLNIPTKELIQALLDVYKLEDNRMVSMRLLDEYLRAARMLSKSLRKELPNKLNPNENALVSFNYLMS